MGRNQKLIPRKYYPEDFFLYRRKSHHDLTPDFTGFLSNRLPSSCKKFYHCPDDMSALARTQSPLTDNERRMITSTFPVLSKARSNENSSHYASELPRHLGLVRQQLVGCCPTGFAEMMASLHLIKVWSYSVVYTSLSL